MFQRYPKVSGSPHKIPLKEVVGFDPVRNQQVHEFLKGPDIVVHSSQQYCLVHYRETCIDKPGQGLSARRGDFTRMVELGHDKNGRSRICLQHGCQLSGNPVGQRCRHPGTEAEHQVGSCFPEYGDDRLQPGIRKGKRIATGDQHLLHLRVLFDILGNLFQLPVGNMGASAGGEPPSETVAAIGGAPVGDEKGDPVRIAVDQSGKDRVGYFKQGVGVFPSCHMRFPYGGNDLFAQGIVGVRRVDQVDEIAADQEWQGIAVVCEPLLFVLGEGEISLKLLAGRYDGLFLHANDVSDIGSTVQRRLQFFCIAP